MVLIERLTMSAEFNPGDFPIGIPEQIQKNWDTLFGPDEITDREAITAGYAKARRELISAAGACALPTAAIVICGVSLVVGKVLSPLHKYRQMKLTPVKRVLLGVDLVANGVVLADRVQRLRDKLDKFSRARAGLSLL
jgi:hypothetical protein